MMRPPRTQNGARREDETVALERVGMRAVFEGGQQYISQVQAAERAQKGLTGAIGGTERQSGSFLKSALAVTAGMAALQVATRAIETGFKVAIKSAIDFESSFAGVRKTVNATEPELKALAQGFRGLAKEIPINVNELNAIGEAAGQLGIKKENILDFTEVMAKLGVTTNLASEEAASSLARFANITGMSQENFDRLGSSIVALGNNFATTEAEIVALSLRLAGAGAQIGLSEAEIAGFATALSSVGIEAEAGGTAISKVFVDIANQVRSGGDNLALFAQIAGMSIEEFSTAFEEDAAGTITAFITGLDRVSQSGGNVFAVLEELGFDQARVRDALLRTSGASGVLTEALRLSASAWDENNALTKEAEQRFNTTQSKIQIAKNNINDLGITIGSALLPALGSMAQALTRAIQAAQNSQALKDFGYIVTTVVGMVIRAVSDLVSVFSVNFGKIGDIVSGTTSLVRKSLEDISPWTRHSPSLVEQVETGVDAILDSYSDLEGISDSTDEAAEAIEALGAAHKSLGRQLDDARGTLQDYADALSDAKAEYESFQNAILAEELPFIEEADALDREMKQIQLQIVKLKQQGPLTVEVTTVRRDKNGNVVRDAQGRPETTTETKDTAIGAQVKALEKQLDSLRLKAQQVDLERDLAIDPLKDQIEDLTETSKTLTFDEIVEGLKTSKQKVDDLTVAHDEWQARVETMEKEYKTLQNAIEDMKAAAATSSETAASEVPEPGTTVGGDPTADAATIANLELAKQTAILDTEAAAHAAGTAYVEETKKQAEAAGFWERIGNWEPVRRGWEAFTKWIEGPFAEKLSGLTEAVMLAWEDIQNFTEKYWGPIQLIIQGAMRIIEGAITGTWYIISNTIEGVLLIITGLINTFFGLLSGDWQRGWDGILQILEGIGQIFVGIIGGILTMLGTALVGVVEIVIGLVVIALDGLGTLLIKAGTDLWKTVTGWFSADAIAGVLTSIKTAGESLGSAIVDGITTGLSKANDVTRDLAKSMFNAMARLINTQLIDRINSALKFSFDTHIPGIGVIEIDPPDIQHIPELAEGGIVRRPTLAMLGETGRQEAVTPIDTFREAVFALGDIKSILARSVGAGADGFRGVAAQFESPLALAARQLQRAGDTITFGPGAIAVDYHGNAEQAEAVGEGIGTGFLNLLRREGRLV